MLAFSHLVVAGLSAAFYLHHGGGGISAAGTAALLAGALAPDIDGGGKITRPGDLVKGLPRLLRAPLNLFGRSGGFIANRTAGHRGFFHWPIVALGLFCCSYYLRSPILFWFAFGYLSHLAADYLTVGGIPLFSPLTAKRYSAKLFKTGSVWEFGFVASCCAAGWYYYLR